MKGLIDDSSVDYQALENQMAAEQALTKPN